MSAEKSIQVKKKNTSKTTPTQGSKVSKQGQVITKVSKHGQVMKHGNYSHISLYQRSSDEFG